MYQSQRKRKKNDNNCKPIAKTYGKNKSKSHSKYVRELFLNIVQTDLFIFALCTLIHLHHLYIHSSSSDPSLKDTIATNCKFVRVDFLNAFPQVKFLTKEPSIQAVLNRKINKKETIQFGNTSSYSVSLLYIMNNLCG